MNKTDFSAVQDVISTLAQQVVSLHGEAQHLSQQITAVQCESQSAVDALLDVIQDYNRQLNDPDTSVSQPLTVIPRRFRLGELLVDLTKDQQVVVTSIPELNDLLSG
ncbi:hypothetical protein [Endozoicomonas ascidiicola]|uniref:hypothetical protein n=1 Tax=Endozoicomonas ascidiicola TaxID=1698521 RepID=UPI000832A3B1|nr:hypothetical protein [Endozoicomonas ascidiicola]